MMKKRIRVFDLAVALAVIIAVTLLVSNHLTSRRVSLEERLRTLQFEQVPLERTRSSLEEELARKDSDSYIIQVAREDYGYLMPGEILFEVSNIDHLYTVHEVTAEPAP